MLLDIMGGLELYVGLRYSRCVALWPFACFTVEERCFVVEGFTKDRD